MSKPQKNHEGRGARQATIVDHVITHGTATAAELAELTARSVMTVHRDIDDLAARGLIRRFHGGVSALPTSVFESTAEFRMHRSPEVKAALARVAYSFIEPGMSVMLDDSTTVFALGRLLEDVGPLTVLTNFRLLAEQLRTQSDIDLIMIGGHYSRAHDSFIGPPDITGIGNYSVDVAFQSTSTMDGEWTYHQEQDVVAMKRVMLASGRRRVLMMDSAKVGRTSLNRFARISDFTDVIVPADVDEDVVARLREYTTVHLAPPAEAPQAD